MSGIHIRKFSSRFFAVIVLMCLFAPGIAHADRIDRLVEQLESDKDYKVRLSAATSLAKVSDNRAVAALIKALGDDDKNVRGVAATSLGKAALKSSSKGLLGALAQALG